MNVQRLRKHPRMGHEPDESADAQPWQTHRNPAIERVLPPRPGLGMPGGLVIVGIDQQVDVRKDHRAMGQGGEDGIRQLPTCLLYTSDAADE